MNVDDVARAVADALDAAGVEYMLTGALASIFYGISRSTLDADFLVQLDPARMEAVMEKLGERFWLDPQPQFELFSGKRYRTLEVRKTPYQVDLFPLSDDPFDQSRFQRRRRVPLLGREIPLPTAEDIVLIKLRWGRRKDLDDARDIIAVQYDRLDRSYLGHWCQTHGTQARLDELLAELGRP